MLLFAAAAGSGCSAVFGPYAGGYGAYPVRHRVPVVPHVDPEAAARGRWDNVMRLPRGATIDVLTADGAGYTGQFAGVNAYSVFVRVNGIEELVRRADVLRVDLVDLPGNEVAAVAKRSAAGALLGLGAMALTGAVIGGSAWPPPGAMLRAGAAVGGVAGAEVELSRRRGRLVYLAESLRVTLVPAETYSPDDWVAIAALAPETRVAVVLRTGARHQGKLIAADDDAVRLDVGGAELRVPRATIVRVEVLSRRKEEG